LLILILVKVVTFDFWQLFGFMRSSLRLIQLFLWRFLCGATSLLLCLDARTAFGFIVLATPIHSGFMVEWQGYTEWHGVPVAWHGSGFLKRKDGEKEITRAEKSLAELEGTSVRLATKKSN